MNPLPGSHQEDYPPRDVEAARRVMTELWQILGEYRDAMVLIGGWVPDLLLPKAIPPHTGSLDVDVLLDPGPLRDQDRYAELVLLLKGRGYEETDKPFKLAKEVTVDVCWVYPSTSICISIALNCVYPVLILLHDVVHVVLPDSITSLILMASAIQMLAGLVGLACGIIWWVKVAGFNRLMSGQA